MKWISGLYLSLLIPATTLGKDIDYSKIAEAISSRVDGIPARYYRLYGEACINIEILNPKTWRAIETKHICEIDGLSFDSDFADVHFSRPEFHEDGLYIAQSITSLRPIGEQNNKCFVPIKRSGIGSIVCVGSN